MKIFEILRIIQSYKVDISKYEWKLYDPTILINGEEYKEIKITFKIKF